MINAEGEGKGAGSKVKVMVEGVNSQAGFRQGYLVPAAFSVAQVKKFIRKVRELKPDEMIVVFHGTQVVKPSTTIGELQQGRVGDEGILTLQYDFVKSFGDVAPCN